MWEPKENHPLRRLFAGLTEHVLIDRFGMADPPLADYLTGLLTRFTHQDAISALRNSQGRPITELLEMLVEAQSLPHGGRTERDYHKHIGDVTLFWTGVFPETFARSQKTAPHLLNYSTMGKRSYAIAGSYDDEKCHKESLVLKRLATEFELCACGLREVRREWESMPPSTSLIRCD